MAREVIREDPYPSDVNGMFAYEVITTTGVTLRICAFTPIQILGAPDECKFISRISPVKFASCFDILADEWHTIVILLRM